MDNVPGHKGIGLAGLCQRPWVLRYLPPGENVISLACDDLVATHKIPRKNLSFIQAIPGGGSLVDAVLAKTHHGFEFATPLDDVSQLFKTASNPGTAGIRYVHAPGWQQQFLITWMITNKSAWSALTPAQQIMVQTVAREHVISSYAENLRQQGASRTGRRAWATAGSRNASRRASTPAGARNLRLFLVNPAGMGRRSVARGRVPERTATAICLQVESRGGRPRRPGVERCRRRARRAGRDTDSADRLDARRRLNAAPDPDLGSSVQ